MKTVLFPLFLIVCSAAAQTPEPALTPTTGQGADTMWIVQQTKPFPFTAHDYALSRINELRDYERSKGTDRTTDYMYRFIGGTSPGKEQSVAITDGKVELENMTMEDAVLLLYSSEADRTLTSMKEWDRQEKMREEAKASIPPDKMKVGPDKWNVHNLPAWSKDPTVMADTTCALKRIRILEDGYNKPDSMLHEMLHAATGCSQDIELHRTIYAMTPKLLKMLQENPDLVKYLTAPPVKAEPKKNEVKP